MSIYVFLKKKTEICLREKTKTEKYWQNIFHKKAILSKEILADWKVHRDVNNSEICHRHTDFCNSKYFFHLTLVCITSASLDYIPDFFFENTSKTYSFFWNNFFNNLGSRLKVVHLNCFVIIYRLVYQLLLHFYWYCCN